MNIDPSAASAQRSLDNAFADNHWTFATVPWNFRPYWSYAAMDPCLAAHIFDKYKDQTINGASREAYGLEIPTLRVVTNMMIKGAKVDLDYCQQKINELGTYAGQIKGYLASTYKIKSVWTSEQIELAFESLDVAVPRKMTKGGQQSWDKEVLEDIDHDLARYLLGVRKIEKQLGPYFQKFQRMADDQDRVHPTIWSMGTRTGRQTVTDPPLQTLHKKDPTVRGAFVPAPGYVIITIDADQIEARLAAHFSQDQGMIEAFTNTDEIDFFVAMARKIFQDQTLQKDDFRRQLTKNTTYAGIYGAGAVRMAATSRVPVEQMMIFIEMFNQIFPGIKRLQQTINRRGSERLRGEGEAYVITPLGRRLPSDEDKDYALLNYLIQGHASEIFKRCMVMLDAAGLGEFMILPVHDEIVMEVPEELAEDVLRLAEEIMNDYTNYAVPITWSGEIMKNNWGEKYANAA